MDREQAFKENIISPKVRKEVVRDQRYGFEEENNCFGVDKFQYQLRIML